MQMLRWRRRLMAHRRIPPAGREVRLATTIAAVSLQVRQPMERILGQRLNVPRDGRGTRA
jgi:hypothetical protein